MGNGLKANGYIDQKAIDQLKEIHDRCFFSTTKQSQYFWRKVCLAAGCTKVKYIEKCQFQSALDQAELILYQAGYDIFHNMCVQPRMVGHA